ncbi:MAG: xanthine dehydrogenase family protein molybdopterin-binding subunit [Burkholderiales bacterium]|nr:xanthine dehydrogenase family protein molybdopterin-binding subunit [Burkholderiales bacterium]MDE2395014.1 xanthine dehydrogenase family protein molybdopterin-binding subunit [Burkholderiales bacterium]MDE2454561.1 xanthine dehydrogenase family protein molybdopterin-binding subunit [Burkholderiales bacterium]
MKRRHVLIAGAALGGGLVALVAALPALPPPSRLGDTRTLGGLNGWVKLLPDGRVVVAVPRSEMGQGVHTALAMLVAEELDADWSQVSIEAAPPDRIYANTALLLNTLPLQSDDDSLLARVAKASVERLGYALSLQVTGGSSSVRDAWQPMRLAGASARSMLVRAAAARWKVEAAECRTEKGIVQHPASGRSARYGELVAEASALEASTDLRLKKPAEFRLIGKPLARIDLPAKVDGSAAYGIDARPEGLVYAALRRCPVFGGKVRRFDAAPALAMRGVKLVFALGDDAVAVVADRWWRARQAAAALNVEFDEGPNAGLDSAAISAQLRRDLDAGSGTGFRSDGDAAKVLAGAHRRIDALYEVPFLAHAAMEPINCTAQVAHGKVTLWNSTQAPIFARWRAAQVAGVDIEAVTLNLPYLGGGFGRRLEVDMVEQAVGIALKTGGAPVKLVWTREDDFAHDVYRPAALARFSAALDAAGRPLAWSNRVCAPSVSRDTVARLLPALAADMPDKNQIEGAFELPYAIPNVSVRQIRSNTPVPVGSWRSVGHSYNAFFTECFMDELAHAAGQDPFDYRRALLGKKPRHRAVLELAAAKAAWGQPLPAGRARGIALHESFGSIVAEVVEVSLVDGWPRVHRVVCAVDCGIVVNPDTVEAQMQGGIVFGLSAALHGRVTIAKGRVVQANFPDYELVRMATMPVIETHIVASNAAPGGVGEPGTPPIAPALANALFALSGKRIRELPLGRIA